MCVELTRNACFEGEIMQQVLGITATAEQSIRFVEMYEHLHRHPELSMQEHQTAAFIREQLARIGAEVINCSETGVVGILRNGDGPTIGFRADIDGLPMKEETALPYASEAVALTGEGASVPVMHGCGHDSHIACALGAAELMADHPEHWKGTIVLIFQPGEEIAAGAARMVDAGLWNLAPQPQVILAQHLAPIPAGTVESRPGPVTSLADSLEVTVRGKGAHGSQPSSAIDPIVIAAFTIVRLQTVVARGTSPLDPVVVTVGTIHAGLKENIIPSEATFTINIRTPDETVRSHVLEQIRRIISAEAAAGGAPEPDVVELYKFPRCYNDPQEFAAVNRSLAAVLGDDNVMTDRARSMGSEDFGWLGDSIEVPTVFWWYGAYARERMADGAPGNHSPHFAPDAQESTEHGIRSALAAILGYVGNTDKASER